MNAIRDLVDIDRDRVLEMLSGGKILAAGSDFVRWQLALSMVKKDPVEATAMVESMSLPRLRTNAFVELARAPPMTERARKQSLLERATLEIKDVPQRPMRARLIMLIMKGWLDLGMRERARPLAQEGQKILDSLPAEIAEGLVPFHAQVARIDPAAALQRIQKLADPYVVRATTIKLPFSSLSSIRPRRSRLSICTKTGPASIVIAWKCGSAADWQ